MLISTTSTHDMAYQEIDSDTLGIFKSLPDELLIKIMDELEVSHVVDRLWFDTMHIISPPPQWFKDFHTKKARQELFP